MPNEDEKIEQESSAKDSSAMENLLEQSEIQPDHEEIEPEITPKEEEKPNEEKEEEKPVEKEEEKKSDDKVEDKKPSKEDDASLEQKPDESDEDWEKRIESIKPKRGASDKTVNAIKEIKTAAREQRQARKAAEKRAKELEEKLNSSETITPERKKVIEEAIAFRQAFDIENDPEFNEKFSKQIEQGEANALAMLRSWRLPENAAKYIQENGGVVRFRTSTELMPSSITKTDGSRMTHAEWWQEKIEGRLTPAQKEQLADELLNLRQLNRTKSQTIKEAQANREQFIQKRQADAVKAAKDWETRVLQHAEKVLPKYGEAAQRKEIPINATEDQKKLINAHNARYDKAQQIAQKYVTDITPENLVEAAIAMGYVTVMQDEMQALKDQASSSDKRVKELEQQINEIKNAGKTSGKGVVSTKTTDQVQSGRRLSDEDAMAEALKTV